MNMMKQRSCGGHGASLHIHLHCWTFQPPKGEHPLNIVDPIITISGAEGLVHMEFFLNCLLDCLVRDGLFAAQASSSAAASAPASASAAAASSPYISVQCGI